MSASEKSLELLRFLSRSPYYHSVTALSEQMGCTKGTVCKQLSVLVEYGFASKTTDKKYSLGPMAFILGKTYEDHIGLSSFVKPFIVQLMERTGENASLSMYMGGRALLIAREEGLHSVSVVGKVMEQRSLHAGASGKLLGAYQSPEEIQKILQMNQYKQYTEKTITTPEGLEREFEIIRKQGYAISDRELTNETIGIAAPVFDGLGNIWAALAIAVPINRISDSKLTEYVSVVREIAAEMTKGISLSEEQN